MALSSSNKSNLISESDYSDFEASMDGENNERVMSFLGESGPGCLNRQDEPKIERESLKRMKNSCLRGRLNQESDDATNGGCITLVNKASENQSLI